MNRHTYSTIVFIFILFNILSIPWGMAMYSGIDDIDDNEIDIDTLISNEDNLTKLSEEGYVNFTIFVDSEGFVWIGSQNGLFRSNGEKFIHFSETRSISIHKIYEDDHHNILLESDAKLIGMIEYINKHQSNKFKILSGEAPNGVLIKKKQTIQREYNFMSEDAYFEGTVFYEDNIRNIILVGTKDGKIYSEQESLGVGKTVSILDTKIKERIVDVEIDHSGAWWILGRKSIWIYRAKREKLVKSQLAEYGGAIWEIIEKDEKVYILETNSVESKIYEWNGKLEANQLNFIPYSTVPFETKNIGVINDTIICMGEDNMMYNPKSQKNTYNTLDSSSTYESMIQYKDKWLIAARYTGLCILSDDTISIPKFLNKTIEQQYNNQLKYVYYILPYKDNQFFTCSVNDGGVNIVTFQNDTIIEIRTLKNLSEKVVTAYYDSEHLNELWVGTRNQGLVHYDLETEKPIKIYDGRLGMLGNTIFSIQPHNGNIWFFSDKGLGCLLYSDSSLSFIGLPDGLPCLDGAGNSSLLRGDTLMFGTDEGLIIFNAKHLADKLKIRNHLGKFRPWPTTIEIHKNGILQDHGKNELEINLENYSKFYIHANDYLYRDLLKYRYAILNLSSKRDIPISAWNTINDKNFFDLSNQNLNYGHYDLVVQAKSEGPWKEAGRVTIKINKPIYKHFGIWILLSLPILLFSWYYIYNYFKGREKKVKELAAIPITVLDFFFKKLVLKSYSINEVAELYYELLKEYDLAEYIFAFTFKVSPDKFKIIIYNENGEWKEDDKMYSFQKTFNGKVYETGEEVIIYNLNDKAQLTKYNVKKRNRSFASEAVSLVCIPIINDDRKTVCTLSLQFSYEKEITEEELFFLKKLGEYFLSLFNPDQLVSPGKHFFDLFIASYNEWMADGKSELPFHFSPTFYRPQQYLIIDLLFGKDIKWVDNFFGLSKDKIYNQDHFVNLIFKGLSGTDSKYPKIFCGKGSKVTVGAIFLVLIASYIRHLNGTSEKFIQGIWKNIPNDAFKDDLFRNKCLRMDSLIWPGSVLQAAFHFGECIFHKNGESNLVACSFDDINYEFILTVKVTDAEKLIRNFKLLKAGENVGGDTSKAYYNFYRLLREGSFRHDINEKNMINFYLRLPS